MAGGIFDGVGDAIFGSHIPYQQQGNDFLKQLSAQMNGNAPPSAAMMAANQGFGKAIAGQQSLAASARPGYEGMAHRQAAQNTAALQGQQATNMTQLAAAEQEAARRQYQEFLLALKQQQMGQPTGTDRVLGGISGGLKALGAGQ